MSFKSMATRAFATQAVFMVIGPSAWVDEFHLTTVSKPLRAFQPSQAVNRQLMVTTGHHRGGGSSEEAEDGEPGTPFFGGSPPFW
jgi:hypothetical protein